MLDSTLMRLLILSLKAICMTLSISLISLTVLSQTRGDKLGASMLKKKDEAVVLMALEKDWALVDFSPDVDFLFFVNEDREELNFYPKKSLIEELENKALISNTDKASSDIRIPSTHYENNFSAGEIKEITEAGSIVYVYQVTEKGKKYLQGILKTGRISIPPLKIATSSRDIPTKIIKVVTYDKQALQKINDEYTKQAQSQVEAAFSVKSGSVSPAPLTASFIIGGKLWKRMLTDAERNGLNPGRLVRYSSIVRNGVERTASSQIDDVAISTERELPIFWKIFREKFLLDDQIVTKNIGATEASVYWREMAERQAPLLVTGNLSFLVESSSTKFIVHIENKRGQDFIHIVPEIRGIELIESKEKQK